MYRENDRDVTQRMEEFKIDKTSNKNIERNKDAYKNEDRADTEIGYCKTDKRCRLYLGRICEKTCKETKLVYLYFSLAFQTKK